MQTKDEHLARCKARALEYVTAGRLDLAVACMNRDLRERPGCTGQDEAALALLGMLAIAKGPGAVRLWVDQCVSEHPRQDNRAHGNTSRRHGHP